jgi:hypothetical protein
MMEGLAAASPTLDLESRDATERIPRIGRAISSIAPT